LDPEKKVRDIKEYCGIPFSVPIRLQLQYIAKSLPDVKRLGVLYDPQNNEALFKQASEIVPNYNIRLVKLNISSPKEITPILDEKLSDIDALWLIPDKSVISESVILYVIKEAVKKKIPIIGYNRFFYESGAAVSFIFDYEELGEQTAKLAIDMLHRNTCSENTPIFHVWLNPRVMKKLGGRMTDKESFPIEIRP
jgi:putative ABC transport system substrate-binding protein